MSDIIDVIDIEDVIHGWVEIENGDVVKISNKLFVAVELNHLENCTGCDLDPGDGRDCLLNRKYLKDKSNMSCARLLKNKILLKGGI